MKKVFLPLVALLMTAQIAFAQDAEKSESPWSHGGNVGLNFAQSYFNNWNGGGQNSINLLGTAVYNIDFAKSKSRWENDIDMKLGYSYYNMKMKPVKTDDRLFLSSLYGYDIHEDILFASALLTFETQFANGYKYDTDSTNRVSGFLAPAYITLGLGIDYKPTKADSRVSFSLNIAPFTGRLTIVNDQKMADAGNYGLKGAVSDTLGNIIEHGKKSRLAIGTQLTANFKAEVFKNVYFQSKLIAFYDYRHKSSDLNALSEKFTCPVDFDWDNALIFKVNSWLSCNVTARLLYDEKIKPIKEGSESFLQFKEVLSIGISYMIP